MTSFQMNPQELQLIKFFLTHGREILQKYMQLLLETPPSSVVDIYVDTIIEICESFHDPDQETESNSLKWMTSVITEIPVTIFTADESKRLVEKFEKNSQGHLGFLQGELMIIYKRAKNHNRRK